MRSESWNEITTKRSEAMRRPNRKLTQDEQQQELKNSKENKNNGVTIELVTYNIASIKLESRQEFTFKQKMEQLTA